MKLMPAESPQPANPDDEVPPDTWRRLYELAAQVYAMAPWKWMEESDIFGVKEAGGDEPLYVSVMGMLGKHRAITVYPGVKNLFQFWQIHEAPNQELMLNIHAQTYQVQAAFVRKNELDHEDRQQLEQFGVKAKGTGWPQFYSYRPGWCQYRVDAREAHWLELTLAQLLVVAPRIQKDRRLLGHGGPDHRYLVRTSDGSSSPTGWKDAHLPAPPPTATYHLFLPPALMDEIRSLPQNNLTIELDVAPSFIPVGKSGQRLETPFLMMAIEPESMFILGMEMLSVEDLVEKMWAAVPVKFLEMLRRHQMRPAALAMCTPWVAMTMAKLCQELEIAVVPDAKLATLMHLRQEIREELFRPGRHS